MARIRSIKPEIWASSDFLKLSLIGRLAFIALISNADDYGRLRTDAHHLALAYLKGSRVDLVERQLDVMEARGMIVRYAVDGHECVAIRSWSDHQKVDHPSRPLIPPPPPIARPRETPRESSQRATRVPADRTGSDQTGSMPRNDSPAARAREAVNNSSADGTGSKDPRNDDGRMTRLGETEAIAGRRPR